MRRHHYTLALLCLACLCGLAEVLCGEDAPRAKLYIIESGSMSPLYPVGVKVVAIERPSYKVGDVVVLRHPYYAKPLLHRIVAIDSHTVTTKGDANKTPDRPVHVSRIVGRVYP